MAEILAIRSRAVGGIRVPTRVRYTVFRTTHASGALPSLADLERGKRPEDVLPVEVADFAASWVRNVSVRTYVPAILNSSARVLDKRSTHGWVRVKSGKWWRVGDIYPQEHRFAHARLVVVTVLAVIALFPAYLMLRSIGRLRRRKQ